MPQGALVFADISGYTQFTRMHVTSLLHAEAIISELLEVVVHATEFPLRVSQLEGDAALLVAETPPGRETDAARDVAWQIQRLFTAFNTHAQALIACDAGCVCEACRAIGQLKLKAVVHFGAFTFLRVGHVEELAGEDVRLLRALIKTPIEAREYILLTPSFYALSGGLPFHAPDQQAELEANGARWLTQVYFPTTQLSAPSLPLKAGQAFSVRLNQHAFARMLGQKTRATFTSVSNGRVNLISYLLEGILSGLNVLRKMILPRPTSPIEIKTAVLVLIELRASLTVSPALDVLRANMFNALLTNLSPLTLNKVGGGIALLYGIVEKENGEVERAVLQHLLGIYRTFRAQIQTLSEKGSMSPAREGSHTLQFRALAHFGPVAIKRILQFEEIGGEAVILLHRLLHNTITAPEYILLTEPLYERMADEEALATAKQSVEVAEGLGEVGVRVVELHL